MCGICGIYNYHSGAPADERLVRAMAQKIIHRGPDDDGFHIDGPFGLGMRRLSIIDLEGGHQPMCNEDSTIWIVFNGEIYNFPDLRCELQVRGHIFRTRSDTETIIHAYEEWGLEAFSKLNGMFAFALWDSRNYKLILARDPFGIKPLYYYNDSQRLLFGSEIKAIVADPSVPRVLDKDALDLYLTFRFIPSPYTLLKSIHKVPPGYYLVCDAQGCRLERYFYNPPGELLYKDENQLVEELRHLLKSAIRRQMISDVPVGALLSGGVDSTTIVTLMQQETNKQVNTFTVGFADRGKFNELEAARQTAQRLGTQHHEIVLSSKDYLGFWEKAMWHLEEPVVTPSILPMYYVSKLARQEVKVVLTGQGADEPWAGYRRYKGEQLASLYQRVPGIIRDRMITPIVEWLPRSDSLKRAVRSLGEKDPAERFVRVYSVFTNEQKAQLYNQDWLSRLDQTTSAIRVWQHEVAHLDSLAQMMYVDARFSLSDDLLLYGDKMSMAVSLEARVPMLDLELMSFVERLPSQMRLKGCTHKYLYRKAISAWLPLEVLRRPKRGFDTPMDKWLAGDLQSYARALWFASDSGSRKYFNMAYLDQLLHEHASGRVDHRRQIYSLLSFEIWHRLFVTN